MVFFETAPTFVSRIIHESETKIKYMRCHTFGIVTISGVSVYRSFSGFTWVVQFICFICRSIVHQKLVLLSWSLLECP